MENPIAEILVQKLVNLCDKFLGASLDVDTMRGVHEEEDCYLLDSEIRKRLKKAGFGSAKKKYFVTQWFLNHLLIAKNH